MTDFAILNAYIYYLGFALMGAGASWGLIWKLFTKDDNLWKRLAKHLIHGVFVGYALIVLSWIAELLYVGFASTLTLCMLLLGFIWMMLGYHYLQHPRKKDASCKFEWWLFAVFVGILAWTLYPWVMQGLWNDLFWRWFWIIGLGTTAVLVAVPHLLSTPDRRKWESIERRYMHHVLWLALGIGMLTVLPAPHLQIAILPVHLWLQIHFGLLLIASTVYTHYKLDHPKWDVAYVLLWMFFAYLILLPI